MGFSEVELIESLVRFDGYDLNEEQLTNLLVSDEDNFVQRLHIGFMFIMENINEQPDMLFLRIINDIISENKMFYYTEEKEAKLNEILCIGDALELAVQLFKFITKNQLFGDASETTALLFISTIYIQNRIGVIKVPKELYHTFMELIEEDDDLINDFILRFCLDTSLFS